MRVTHIDFAAAPRPGRIGIAVLTVGVLAAGMAMLDDSRSSEVVVQLQGKHERLATAVERIRRVAGTTPANAMLSQSDQAMRRIAAPWGTLLDALEQAQMKSESVALLGIEPDSTRGRLRVSGEAKNFAALVDYMGFLEGQGGLSALRLLTQQIKREDAEHPVVFQFEAKWGVTADPKASGSRPDEQAGRRS